MSWRIPAGGLSSIFDAHLVCNNTFQNQNVFLGGDVLPFVTSVATVLDTTVRLVVELFKEPAIWVRFLHDPDVQQNWWS